MPLNINPNYNEATQETNQLFNTQIPALSEDANIQEALRLYHYGSATVQPTTNATIEPNSLAGHLKDLKDDITELQAIGVGSGFSNTEPVNPEDGYIWVKGDAIANPLLGTVAYYDVSAPTVGLVHGQLWVDKDSSPLKMYVYDGSSASWKEIGA